MSFIDKLNRFASNPVNMNMKRSKFNLSHGHKLTMNAGLLVPILVEEVLPGDSFKLNVSSVIRSITPAVPVMDNAYIDLFAFWVPARLCTVGDKDWQKIHGENTTGYWAPATESTLQNTGNTFTLGSGLPIAAQSLGNYMGLPNGFYHSTMELSRLPFAAYFEIYNHWFRDQNTQAPEDWKTWSNYTFGYCVSIGASCKAVNKFHDYFTSALPSPQKGASVLLPIAGSSPIKTSSSDVITATGANPLLLKQTSDGTSPSGAAVGANVFGVNMMTGVSGSTSTNYVVPTNLYADLTAATAVSVNEMRQAFAIQKLFEKDARGGKKPLCFHVKKIGEKIWKAKHFCAC